MERNKLWIGAGRTYTWNEARETAIRLIISIRRMYEEQKDWQTNTCPVFAPMRVWEFTREDSMLWRNLGMDKEVSRNFPKWLYDNCSPRLLRDARGRNYNSLGFVSAVMYRMLTGHLPFKMDNLWTESEKERIGLGRIALIDVGMRGAFDGKEESYKKLGYHLEMLLDIDGLKADESVCTFEGNATETPDYHDGESDDSSMGFEDFIKKLDLVPNAQDKNDDKKSGEDNSWEHSVETPVNTPEAKVPDVDDDEDDDDIDDLISGPDPAGRPKCNIEFRKARRGEKGFAEVAGMDELKQKLEDEVLFVLRSPKLAKRYRLNAANGMILYGPPGCGKTYIAQKFAVESGMKFALITGSDLGSTYIHGSQSMIADLFSKAERNAPCVLCFDEIDALLPRRRSDGSSGDNSLSSEVNEMLSQLNNCHERGIFVIGTTNEPESIDPAILRAGRLEEMVYVPLPDMATRRLLFAHALQNRPLADDIDYDALATKTEGYVSSDISLIADRAALRAAKRCELIRMDDLNEVIGKTRRSIAADDMKRYLQMKTQFEGNNTRRSSQRPRIGFAAACQDNVR